MVPEQVKAFRYIGEVTPELKEYLAECHFELVKDPTPERIVVMNKCHSPTLRASLEVPNGYWIVCDHQDDPDEYALSDEEFKKEFEVDQ